MNGVSEVFATVIMTGVLLALLSIVLGYSYLTGFGNVYRAEYIYYRQVLLNMATNMYYVLNGGDYVVTYPKSTMALGYRQSGYVRVYVNSSTSPVLELPCYSVTAASYSTYTQSSRYLYGNGSLVVDDPRLLPSVREFYENGSARIELDTCRLYASVQATFDRLGSFYYFNVVVVVLNPVLAPGRGFAEVYASSSSTYWYSNVYNLTVVVKSPALSSPATLGPRDIYSQYTGGPVTVSLTVVNVTVVMG
ncbi:hypothetical protein TCELL_1224 [Thermogladius calderae 1633]|uniref:Flagellin n=1 Tax=Thermogladius calderae (strain DSM 22663 / VKM B-2946 / 1633) TaxID=1184251 RepID=I3TFV9_THEC1|nr:hypothetical protein [Thermogladius calderae]AFK51647.1 hypothetical protein TCELL_1224 [Thermogladius calderae 1633]